MRSENEPSCGPIGVNAENATDARARQLAEADGLADGVPSLAEAEGEELGLAEGVPSLAEAEGEELGLLLKELISSEPAGAPGPGGVP
jgi:hypothetical protein